MTYDHQAALQVIGIDAAFLPLVSLDCSGHAATTVRRLAGDLHWQNCRACIAAEQSRMFSSDTKQCCTTQTEAFHPQQQQDVPKPPCFGKDLYVKTKPAWEQAGCISSKQTSQKLSYAETQL